LSDRRTSTVAGGQDEVGAPTRISLAELRRARALRRMILLLLLVFLVLGALNFFGGRTSKTQAQAGDWQLEVTYPRTGRPGIGAPFEIQVQHDGGFDGPVSVSVTSDYLDVLDVRSIDPDPSQATASDKAVTWQFDSPQGDTLSVSLNAEFEPDEHPGPHDATVTVLDNDKPVVHTRFRTWEAP
jgi:hypothetical protein